MVLTLKLQINPDKLEPEALTIAKQMLNIECNRTLFDPITGNIIPKPTEIPYNLYKTAQGIEYELETRVGFLHIYTPSDSIFTQLISTINRALDVILFIHPEIKKYISRKPTIKPTSGQYVADRSNSIAASDIDRFSSVVMSHVIKNVEQLPKNYRYIATASELYSAASRLPAQFVWFVCNNNLVLSIKLKTRERAFSDIYLAHALSTIICDCNDIMDPQYITPGILQIDYPKFDNYKLPARCMTPYTIQIGSSSGIEYEILQYFNAKIYITPYNLSNKNYGAKIPTDVLELRYPSELSPTPPPTTTPPPRWWIKLISKKITTQYSKNERNCCFISGLPLYDTVLVVKVDNITGITGESHVMLAHPAAYNRIEKYEAHVKPIGHTQYPKTMANIIKELPVGVSDQSAPSNTKTLVKPLKNIFLAIEKYGIHETKPLYTNLNAKYVVYDLENKHTYLGTTELNDFSMNFIKNNIDIDVSIFHVELI